MTDSNHCILKGGYIPDSKKLFKWILGLDLFLYPRL